MIERLADIGKEFIEIGKEVLFVVMWYVIFLLIVILHAISRDE